MRIDEQYRDVKLNDRLVSPALRYLKHSFMPASVNYRMVEPNERFSTYIGVRVTIWSGAPYNTPGAFSLFFSFIFP